MLTRRRLGILHELGHGRVVTAPALSERFGVTTKTIRRDIAELVALGAPVETRLGRHGGWTLTEPPAPDEGAIRVVVPADELPRLLRIEGVRTLVYAAVGHDHVRAEVAAADTDDAARAVAMLPVPVTVEWPQEAAARIAEVGRSVARWYGGSGPTVAAPGGCLGRDAVGGTTSAGPIGPPDGRGSVRDRLGELPSPRRLPADRDAESDR